MAQMVVPEVRNAKFQTDEAIPRHWHGGRRSVSIFYDNLSILFPLGERFFIASVRRFAKDVEDPELKKAVAAFIGQEGIHTREHVRYNERLAAEGYPVESLEKGVAWLLGGARKYLPKRMQLAATVGLEHFTASLGYYVLRDPRILEGAHPTMAALWRWHAAEEIEHRAVAFDVYKRAGGTTAERSVVMLAATVIFWIKVFEQQARMMKHDGIAFSASEWAGLFEYLFKSPGGLQDLFPTWLRYFSPKFDPTKDTHFRVFDEWIAKHLGELEADAQGALRPAYAQGTVAA